MLQQGSVALEGKDRPCRNVITHCERAGILEYSLLSHSADFAGEDRHVRYALVGRHQIGTRPFPRPSIFANKPN